jgi:hypothetical protein
VFLTPELLKKLADIIRKHHLAFIVSVFGEDAASKEEVKSLKAAGLVDEDTLVALDDAYAFGQVLAKLNDPATAAWTPEQLKAYLKKHPIPLTEPEKNAAKNARLSGAMYVKGLGNTVEKQTGQLLINADKQLEAALKDKIKDEVTRGIEERKTVKAIKSDLGHAMQDWTRNLDRIAITEKHAAMATGVVDGIVKQHGGEALIYIQPMPDACPDCKRLHLGPDGMPRIFKTSQLAPQGANVGKKKHQWVPAIPPIHPHCQCVPVHVPVGWGFNEKGQLVPGGEGGVSYAEKSFRKTSFEELRKAEEDHRDRIFKGFRITGRTEVHGLLIAVEQEPGDIRTWADRNGDSGFTVMRAPYGFIEGVIGADGEHLDVYLGPDPEPENVFVVNQTKKLPNGGFGGFDEQKVMLGFSSAQHARETYLEHYADPRFLGSMETLPLHEFVEWCRSGKGAAGDVIEGEPQLKKGDRIFVDQASGGGPMAPDTVPRPVPEHDVRGMRIFLKDTTTPRDEVTFQRDDLKAIYELDSPGSFRTKDVKQVVEHRMLTADEDLTRDAELNRAAAEEHLKHVTPKEDVGPLRLDAVQREGRALAKAWLESFAKAHDGEVRPFRSDTMLVLKRSDAAYAALEIIRKSYGVHEAILDAPGSFIMRLSGKSLDLLPRRRAPARRAFTGATE